MLVDAHPEHPHRYLGRQHPTGIAVLPDQGEPGPGSAAAAHLGAPPASIHAGAPVSTVHDGLVLDAAVGVLARALGSNCLGYHLRAGHPDLDLHPVLGAASTCPQPQGNVGH